MSDFSELIFQFYIEIIPSQTHPLEIVLSHFWTQNQARFVDILIEDF